MGGARVCVIKGGAVLCTREHELGKIHDFEANPVPGLESGVSKIFLRKDGLCVLMAGELKCQGPNTYGQLGVGDTNSRSTVTNVMDGGAPLAGVTDVSLSDVHSYAIVTGGQVKCWGRNEAAGGGPPRYGWLGNNTTVDYATTPQTVLLASGAPLTNVTAVSVGSGYDCATSGGALYCWGINRWAGLATGDRDDYLVATPSPLFSRDVTALDARSGATYVIHEGLLKRMGRPGTTSNSPGFIKLVDELMDTLNPRPAEGFSALAGGRGICGIRSGRVYCHKSHPNDINIWLQRTDRGEVLEGVDKLVTNYHQACALARGQVYCSNDRHDEETRRLYGDELLFSRFGF